MSDRRPQAFTEYFRLHDGQMDDTQFNIVSQDEVATPDTGYAGGYGDGDRVYYPTAIRASRTYYPNSYGGLGSFFGLFGGGPSYVQQQRPIPPPAAQPNYGGPFGEQRSRSSEDRRFVAAPRRPGLSLSRPALLIRITKRIRFSMKIHCLAFALGCSSSRCGAAAQEFQLQEAPSLPPLTAGPLPPRTILFTDHRKDELVDPVTGLIRFADWARGAAAAKAAAEPVSVL